MVYQAAIIMILLIKMRQEGFMRFKGYIHAPEFAEGLEWINTERPLKIEALRGKIVLLEFWTYC
jgi:hypothetical protein